jgi:hypothetical protein
MADVKISALNALGAAPAAADLIPVVDVSGSETKKLRIDELFTNPNVTGTVTADGVIVNGGADIQLAGGQALKSVNTINIDADYDGSGVGVLNLNTAGVLRQQITNNGDISFYEDTGTTAKFFWDASAESLGIGTTTPARNITISDTSNPYIGFERNEAEKWVIGSDANDRFIIYDTVAGANRLLIDDASGFVGIGTLNPVDELHVANSLDPRIRIDAKTSGQESTLLLLNSADGQYAQIANVGNALKFLTGASERARIDSSGNLLVGKTSANSVTASGIELQSSGLFAATRDGGNVGLFNRETSDGDIVQFRKDNNTVGSIRSKFGDIVVGNSGTVGIRFDEGTGLVPWDMTADAAEDAQHDIGAPSARYKDLYLSGGVYLGGTAGPTGDPNNYLDDYEEGTFTPVVEGGTTAGTGTYTTQYGVYTKTGDTVTFTAFIVWSAHSGSGVLLVGGLPFASNGSSNYRATFATYPSNISLSASHIAAGLMTANVTHILVRQLPVGGGADASVNLDTAGTIIISGSYKV